MRILLEHLLNYSVLCLITYLQQQHRWEEVEEEEVVEEEEELDITIQVIE